ncbi:hypothetical protein OOK13_45155 [Streptomyces sp. NBC_00378]|uniref:hypothetical protein n=1 Tax=Streptomyces sp. NBC_00378 TaxID=2975732 RepID=UPI002253AC20|nr:hypothetical protein [Streptomyces sp. NBC_00378]MCX5115488.1 hypothetical protein [Streptomyces sp. NBC_00378]
MTFRKTISQSELREKLPKSEQDSGPVYQSSRGCWDTETDKPVPGTPQEDGQ